MAHFMARGSSTRWTSLVQLATIAIASFVSPSANAVAPAPAGGVTMVDCTKRENENDVKCTSSQVGMVGSGPKFKGGLTTSVGHGFVSGNQLIVAVELTASDDDLGGIFGIELATGKRTLLSGKLKDPVEGDVTKGTGKSLNQVQDVALAPNGSWVAFTAAAGNRTLLSIDPATGNRKVFFDGGMSPCAGITGKVMLDSSSGITVGSDGATYAVINNNPKGSGKGIARITPDGKCSIVTLSASASSNKGSGPDVIGSFLYNVTFRDDALYVLQFNTHPSILSIDPKTGNRRMITVSPDKGSGPELAGDSMTVAPDGTLWTYNAYRSGVYGLVSVDPATGNRTRYEVKGGPAKMAQGSARGIWVHPDGKHVLLHYANAILIYDPATGNSNTLSY